MNTDFESSQKPCSWIADQVRNDKWRRALAQYRTCDAALQAAAHTEDEDLYDRLGERHHDALQTLLCTRAPDAAALALKLDLALDERVCEYLGDLAGMKALKTDARRLSGGGLSRSALRLSHAKPRRREGSEPDEGRGPI